MGESSPGFTVKSTFFLSGTRLDPDAVTRVLALEPTGVARERRISGTFVREPFWSLSEEEGVFDLDESVDGLLRILWPRRAQIITFLRRDRYVPSITSIVRFTGDLPRLDLRPRTVRKLAELGAGWSLDPVDRA